MIQGKGVNKSEQQGDYFSTDQDPSNPNIFCASWGYGLLSMEHICLHI